MIEARALHHVGIAVRSIESRRDFYERTLGARFAGIETVPEQKVRVAAFLVGAPGREVRIELLEPTSEDSPVARFLERRGEGLHHLAFSTDRLPERLEALAAASVPLVDPKARGGAHGTRIAFLHPAAGGGVLVELCEPGD